MSNARYLEIDSTYRNRNQFSNPSQFNVLISQRGTRDKKQAKDPISLETPIHTFSGSFQNTGISDTVDVAILTTGLGETSDPTKFTVSATSGELRQINEYYNGAIIDFDGPPSASRRIVDYTFVNDGGINPPEDIAIITVDTAIPDDLLVDGTPASITNPSDTTLTQPKIFIGGGDFNIGEQSSSVTDNSYDNYILYNETTNESTTITSYDGETHIACITPTLSTTGWTGTNSFSIREKLPCFSGTGTVTNASTIILDPLASPSTSENAVGNFIRITEGSIPPIPVDGINEFNQIRKIVSYDEKTRTAGVSPGFDPVPAVGPAVTEYEVLCFTRDNCVPFTYTGSLVSQQQMVCYEIELINIILPNILLTTGGRIAFYPYVYVELQNLSASSAGNQNIIYSNNPNATRMLFRAPIDDIPTPVISPFIKIDGDGMVQTVKFKPNDNLTFAVYLPNGLLFETELKDTVSPALPNPLVQISAMFSIRRL